MREGGSDEVAGVEVPLALGSTLALAAADFESRKPEKERRFCFLVSPVVISLLLLEEDPPFSRELNLNLAILTVVPPKVWSGFCRSLGLIFGPRIRGYEMSPDYLVVHLNNNLAFLRQ